MLTILESLDQNYSKKIHEKDNKFLSIILIPFLNIFNRPRYIIFPFILIFQLFGQIIAQKYFNCIIFGLIISTFLKKSFNRNRPSFKDFKFKHKDLKYRIAENNKSMPSGDSVQVSIFSYFLIFNGINPIFSITIMIIVMYSRIYFLCHYICDTIIGSLIGFNLALIFLNKSYLFNY